MPSLVPSFGMLGAFSAFVFAFRLICSMIDSFACLLVCVPCTCPVPSDALELELLMVVNYYAGGKN